MIITDIPSPPGLEFDIAKPEDYEGVMDIDKNIYDGVDYLPTKYMEYVNDPNRLCIVGRKNGKIVAFGMNFVVDGGKTIIKQAGRVIQDYQGLGYTTYFHDVSMEILSKKYDLELITWTSINREANEGLVKRHSDISFIVVRPRFSLDFSPLELERSLKKPEFQDLQKMSQKYSTLTLTPSGVKDVMSKFPQDVAAIVPEGFWVVNWESFKPMACNYDLITKDSIVHVTTTTDGSLLAVSYGTSVEVKVGLRYRADYYVRPEHANNKELFVSHLTRHLVHVHQFYRGKNVSFSILYPQNVAKMASGIKEVLEKSLDLRRKQSSEAPCLLLKRVIFPNQSNLSAKL